MHRRQTTTGCAFAAAAAKPSPLPRFSEPGSPILGDNVRRQTAAGNMSPTSAVSTAAGAAPATATKPASVLLRARSATDHPASWSIHAFDASSACSTPASCPGTPAAQTPAGAPATAGSACPSATSSTSFGHLLVTPRQQAAATPSPAPLLCTNELRASHSSDRRQTVAGGSPAATAARPRSLLSRFRSLNAREDPASFAVEASSGCTSACSTPSASGSTAASPAAPGLAGAHGLQDQAGTNGQKQPVAVALGQPCTALVLAPSVKAIVVAQPPLGARQLACLPFSRGPTLDMELSPEEVRCCPGYLGDEC
ncbi:hypothetical protein COHA_008403 [Chlorella ohadii]|uniref:Uncharacterized protein n=1 Tax=Chlorella ohadii TaxID=2649997 RepID=A0AAD5DK05_9CHLO|nr:hypothetical protein COHA_008403 [Chlorella ohadii]